MFCYSFISKNNKNMKKKIFEIIYWGIVLILLSVWTAWPYWKASALATSRSGYLIWALSSSFVALFLLLWVSIILWTFFRKHRTAILVIGIISIIFGTTLSFNAPEILERAAPELQEAGTVKWLKTSINQRRFNHRPESRRVSYNHRYKRAAIAAKVLPEDGTTVQALNISFLNNSGYMVELHRDRGGTYWVGEIAEDRTKKTGVLYILMGLMLLILLPISRIVPIRKFLLIIKDEYNTL